MLKNTNERQYEIGAEYIWWVVGSVGEYRPRLLFSVAGIAWGVEARG